MIGAIAISADEGEILIVFAGNQIAELPGFPVFAGFELREVIEVACERGVTDGESLIAGVADESAARVLAAVLVLVLTIGR